MQIIEGDRLVTIEPVYDQERQKYIFPCGCEFDVDPEGESPNGHPSLILNRDLREDCPLVWNMLATGLTTGVFQLESNLGMSYARKLKPESIEQVSGLVAILRPGVLKVKDEDGVNTADHYCYRKNGVEPVHDRFPVIGHILARSYGLMIYQEQHTQIARLLCDFTPIEADWLRKSVSKKDVEEIRKVGKTFVDRAALKGLVTREEAQMIFNDIEKSGRYAFNACVLGSESIKRPSPGKHPFLPTVEEMYLIKNDLEYAKRIGKLPLRSKMRRLGYGLGLSLDSDGRIRQNKIVDIQPAGKRLVYEVVLENGMKTRVTGNHKFPTKFGDMTVDQLRILPNFPELFVCGKYEHTIFNYAYSNVTRKQLDAQKSSKSVLRQFGESNYGYTNGSFTKCELYRKTTPDVCEQCGKMDCRIEIHHKDEDRANSEPENLEKLCVPCHKRAQYKLGRTKRGQKGYPVEYSKIQSIAPIGEHTVYDVTMDEPNHTFVTGEGILTCNSHSVGYALSSFETAYWKAHLPIYFFTSYLDKSSYKQKPRDEIRRLMKEIRKLRIRVLPPRFTELQPLFISDNVKVRFGLSNVSGIGAKTIDKAAEQIDREALMEWSWYEFLTLGLDICRPAMVKAAINAGGFDDFDLQRLRMLDEIKAWCDLTERERTAIVELGDPIYETVPIIETQEVEVEEPVYDKAAMKSYKESLKGDSPLEHPAATGIKFKKKKVKVKVGEEQVLVDEAREVDNLESALANLMERPGVLGKARRDKVGTILDLLRNPPSPQIDQPYMKVKQEVELLGVALTASTVDGVDVSLADTTIPDFLDGFDEEECVIACEVFEYFERTVRTGPNAGAKMGTLVVGDGENVLENVVMFSQAWEDYGHVVMRPNAAVALRGKRHWKDEKTFVVNEAEALA